MRMSLGHNIKRIREERGLTQQELSEKANTHSTYISALENDVKAPGAEMITNLARALDCTPNDLLGFTVEGAA